METLTLTADNQLYQSFFKGLVESFEQMKQSLFVMPPDGLVEARIKTVDNQKNPSRYV